MAAITMLAAACSMDNDVALNAYSHIEGGEWGAQDVRPFVLDTVKVAGDYTLSVNLRTTTEVPLQQVYVCVEQQLANPSAHIKDTLLIRLTDDKGKMLGKGFALYNYQTSLPRPTHLSKGQCGEIRIRHIMRLSPLQGIVDVGIKMEK